MNDQNTIDDYEICLRVMRMVGGDDPTQSVGEVVELCKVRISQLRQSKERIERETYARQIEQEAKLERIGE